MAEQRQFDTYPTDGTFDEFKAPDVTAWKLARSAIEHENHLINHRLTWLVQVQLFLFSAFVLLFAAWARKSELTESSQAVIPWLLIAIGLFAMYACVVIQVAVGRAYYALEDLTVKYKDLATKNNFGSRTPPLHKWLKPPLWGLFDQQYLPLALAVVWLMILIILTLSRFPMLLTIITSIGLKDALMLLAFVAVLVVGYLLGISTRRKGRTEHGFDS